MVSYFKLLLKKILPDARYQALARRYNLLIRWGLARECPCCGRRFRRFEPFGDPVRPEARCYGCGALERHRLLCLHLGRDGTAGMTVERMLHFAPEPCLSLRLSQGARTAYVTVDYNALPVSTRADAHHLPFADSSFDLAVINHVLEHLSDDLRALREIHRVLTGRGSAVVMVPQRSRLKRTVEASPGATPEELRAAFGQEDHLRLYGADFADRLRGAGFEVTVITAADLMEESVSRYGLPEHERLYVCRKSGR